ncbi:insulinase family protein [Candidatus Azambacteria bacterium]|nr:insulinase family protein [Candidatus Azambacteria bacterium]
MFKKEILKNNLRLITAHTKDTKTITVLVLVGVGSKYETKNISGISHFLEHMMFKGTKKRKDTLAISSELDSIGAEYNAFTGNEYTGYYVKADASHLELALDVVADMLLNSKFDSKEIEKEKGVVIEEINMYKDNPARQVSQNLESLIYGDQPAGWDIAGTRDTVTSFTRKDINGYFESHYTNENTIVCVAGNFEKKSIKEKVEKYFSNLRKGERLEKKKVLESQKEPKLGIEHKKTDQSHLVLAFRSFISVTDKKLMAESLLANILGGNMSSRLFINIREKQGLAYYIGAGTDSSADTGYFYIRAGVDNKRVQGAIKGILAEVKKVKQRGVTAAELKKAKEYFKGKTVMGIESSDELAEFLGFQEILKNEILTLEEVIKKIDAVSLAEVNKIAKEVFQNKNMNLALIGPFKDKKEFENILKIS